MADDGFETYFAEKLWRMVPAVYRHEDGLGDPPGVLRALVEILAHQAAVLRRSHDRLWEDQFIELCDSWAVPYLGDLVGTRLLSALNPRGRRVDVAKTIYYRRRAGTPALLEELISDITGWEGTVVEGFRRLGRAWHRLDPTPGSRSGRFTGTPPGGWADLRRPRGTELAGGPFDELHHTPDLRRPRGRDGRHGISRIVFHLYRLPAFQVTGVTPHAAAGGHGFTFDPSGREVPLFMPRNRPQDPAPGSGREADWGLWRHAREWELPAPLRCRVLGHAEFEIDEALILDLVEVLGLTDEQADELRRLRGRRLRSEARLRSALAGLPHATDLLAPGIYQPLLAGSLVDDCGLRRLWPDALRVVEPPDGVERRRVAAGDLAGWSATAAGKRLIVDPERGRLLFLGSPPAAEEIAVSYHYGFSGAIGAGTFDRRELEEVPPDRRRSGGGQLEAADIDNGGVTQLNDSATYGPVPNKLAVRELTLRAANQERPYLRLASDWVLSTGPLDDSTLVLDGLWIGADDPVDLILRGDYERVVLRHVTLDPGGERREGAVGDELPAISLVIEGEVERLEIEASITGPIRTRVQAGKDHKGVIEELQVRDSILQSPQPGTPAIDLDRGEVTLERVTVLGALGVHRLRLATETLVTGFAAVADVQTGCFRFSAAPAGSRLPRPYESHVLLDAEHLFTSRRFGHPGYAQLSQTAPVGLRRGAEDGSEIGAFSRLRNSNKLDSLEAKVQEFLPFGLFPLYLRET